MPLSLIIVLWLKPEIQVISRDRGADYATAATQGAPQAIQVADRWHIVHNLSEALSLVFEHYRAQLRSVSHALAPAPMAESERQPPQKDVPETSLSPLPIASGQPYRAPFIQHVQRARRESRLQRYQQLVALQREGMTTAQIAQQTGLSPRSIRRWLAQEHVPEGRQRRRRPSLIDPYEPYVLMRWQQGCHNGLQIWREIAARGYSGSPNVNVKGKVAHPTIWGTLPD